MHDHVFVRAPNGMYYSDGKLVASSWERYLEFCEKLYIVCRVSDVIDEAAILKLDLSSRENVEFVPVIGVSHYTVIFRNFFVNYRTLYSIFRRSTLIILRVPSFTSFIAYLVILRLNTKYCVEVVASARESLVAILGTKGIFVAWALEKFTKFIVGRAVGAIYVTKSFLQRKYPTKKVAAVASNIELAAVGADVLMRRLSSATAASTFRLGVIGSYTQNYKGIDLAVHALKILQDSGMNFTLEVVGKGDSSILIELAKSLGVEDRVKFVGTVKSGRDIYAWLDTVDMYIQPSRTEGLPRSLVEAMSRGCPVVASRIGGIPELVDPEFLHESGDYEELAKKIAVLAACPTVRQCQSKINFEKAALYYADNLRVVRSDFFSAVLESIPPVQLG